MRGLGRQRNGNYALLGWCRIVHPRTATVRGWRLRCRPPAGYGAGGSPPAARHANRAAPTPCHGAVLRRTSAVPSPRLPGSSKCLAGRCRPAGRRRFLHACTPTAPAQQRGAFWRWAQVVWLLGLRTATLGTEMAQRARRDSTGRPERGRRRWGESPGRSRSRRRDGRAAPQAEGRRRRCARSWAPSFALCAPAPAASRASRIHRLALVSAHVKHRQAHAPGRQGHPFPAVLEAARAGAEWHGRCGAQHDSAAIGPGRPTRARRRGAPYIRGGAPDSAAAPWRR